MLRRRTSALSHGQDPEPPSPSGSLYASAACASPSPSPMAAGVLGPKLFKTRWQRAARQVLGVEPIVITRWPCENRHIDENMQLSLKALAERRAAGG